MPLWRAFEIRRIIFDFANGNGKEFRPYFFGVGAGESTTRIIVTFIAGQHFEKNVENIDFEFDVVSSWHSDMAKSFTSLPDSPVVLYSHHTKFGNATKSSVLQR